MATLHEIADRFSTMESRMRSNVRNALYSEATSLVADFQQRSPVDTSFYKSQWRIDRAGTTSGASLGSIGIYNPTDYGYSMEYGGTPGGSPWYYPTKKKSKKLKVKDGRVWAGGLNPGFAKTIGGAIGPGLLNNNRRLNKLTNSIADAVIGAL